MSEKEVSGGEMNRLLSGVTILVSIVYYSVNIQANPLGNEDHFTTFATERLVILPEGMDHKDYKVVPPEFQSERLTAYLAQVKSFEHERSVSKYFKKLKRKFSWVPRSDLHYFENPNCSPNQIEQIIQDPEIDAKSQAQLIRVFLQECKSDMFGVSSGEYLSMVKLSLAQYDILENPNVRPVLFKLDDDSIVRGYLGLKPDNKPRPLVMIKCGITCNVDNSSELLIMAMHLFDESPFNVLLLGNISGSDFQKDNGHFAVGGFFEGIQTMGLANLLKRGPINNVISDLHMIGISLGGHAAFYTALYNDHNLDVDQNPLFNSVTAICPVANLQAAANGVYSSGSYVKNKLAVLATWRKITKLVGWVPFLGQYLEIGAKPSSSLVIDTLVNGSLDYYKKKMKEEPEWVLEPFKDAEISNHQDFWRLNDFRNFSNTIKTPTLVIAAKNDVVVSSQLNAFELDQEKTSSPYLNVLRMRKGSHCAFSINYGWRYFSALLRGYILSKSPGFDVNTSFSDYLLPSRITKRRSLKLRSDEVHVGQKVYVRKGQPNLYIKFKIYSYDDFFATTGTECMNTHYRLLPSYCFRTSLVKIPFSQLSQMNLKTPSNQTEAEAMTRLLNITTQVLDSSHSKIHRSNTRPYMIRMKHWQ